MRHDHLRTAFLAASVLACGAGVEAEVHVEGDLPRQAAVGFGVAAGPRGLEVREVAAGSPAFDAGLRPGDVIRAVGGVAFARPHVGEALLERADGGRELRLDVEGAGGTPRTLRFTPAAKPLERLERLDSYYGVVDTPDGARLRTILTRPEGSRGPLPAIFFVQWVSCDSVEFTTPGAWIDVYRAVAQRSGMAMIRVERSANGDSQGPACHELDLETELAHYRHAFDALVRPPHVDPARVVVMGNSLGSMLVPLVAQGRRVAGATIAAGGGLTYFERMLHFDRQALERGGGSPADVGPRLLAQARFHVEYLLNARTPEQIAARDPEQGAVWRQIPHTGDGVHYGRPYAYHHQAARLNLLQAWAAVAAPVLVVFGEFDQYESLRGAQVVVETVNRLRPGTARLAVLPMLDHSFYLAPTADAAFRGERRVPAPEPAAQVLLDWLRHDVLGREPTRTPPSD